MLFFSFFFFLCVCVCVCVFLKKRHTLCLMDVPIYSLTKSAGEFPALCILCNMYCREFAEMPILTGVR